MDSSNNIPTETPVTPEQASATDSIPATVDPKEVTPQGAVIGENEAAFIYSVQPVAAISNELFSEQADMVDMINRLGQMLAAEPDLKRIVQALTDAATEVTRAQFGSFFYNVLDEKGESYMLYTLSGVPREHFAHFPMPRATDLFGPTFRGDGTILSSNVKNDPRYGKNSPYFGMPKGHLPVVSYLAVPVISRSGEVFGGLFFGHSSEGVFNERDARVCEGLAGQAAIAMDNARLIDEIRREQVKSKELYEREQEARLHAETANRMKDEFLAIVSHELRSPLNAILGWTSVVRGGNLHEEELESALETIERNARTQAQLIEDILDYERIVTGKIKLNVQEVDLDRVVHLAVDVVRPAIESKEIKLQIVLDTAQRPVMGDPDRLQQVIWNLLSNAVKFTPRGGKIQVQLKHVNSHVQVVVSDTGQGIELDFLPYVFERFRQGDTKTTRKHGGLGLGLAIAKHIVELHGGAIHAQSEGTGKGSTFSFSLPVAIARTAERNASSTTPKHPDLHHQEVSLEGLRILILDDQQDARDLIEFILKQYHGTPLNCPDATSAFETYEREQPDIIISDIEMPDIDGYEFIRMIRERENTNGRRTPAIALTAHARPADRLEAITAGFFVHMTKPVDPMELVVTIANFAKAK